MLYNVSGETWQSKSDKILFGNPKSDIFLCFVTGALEKKTEKTIYEKKTTSFITVTSPPLTNIKVTHHFTSVALCTRQQFLGGTSVDIIKSGLALLVRTTLVSCLT